MPGTTDDVVEIVNVVERLAELIEVEPKRVVTPAGAPEADNEIVCEVPDTVEVVSVEVALVPALTDPEVGDSAMPKSLVVGALTVKV